MSSDHRIESEQLMKMNARIRAFQIPHDDDRDAIELTRMQGFLEGSYDIFDLLERQQANRNTPSLFEPLAAQERKNKMTQAQKRRAKGFNMSQLTAYLKKHLGSFIF